MAPDGMGYGGNLWEIACRHRELCESTRNQAWDIEHTSSGVRGSRGCLEGKTLAGAGEASTVVAVLGAVKGADMDGVIELGAIVEGWRTRSFK